MTTVEGNDRSASVLAELIEARKTACGETAQQAVDATAINVLTSLRADTAVVGRKPDIFNGRYYVEIEESGEYVPGWANPPRKGARGRRVARPSGGGASLDRINGYRIINKAGSYSRAKNARLFKIAIYNKDSDGRHFFPAKDVDGIYVFALDESDVEKYADSLIRRRIAQYRGVSKRALGVAMHAIAARSSGGALSAELERLAASVVDVEKIGGGFNSGRYAVKIEDNLPHAAQSLRSGSIDLALQKASNRTSAIINRKLSSTLYEPVETPFPDVVANSGRSRTAKRASGVNFPGRDSMLVFRI